MSRNFTLSCDSNQSFRIIGKTKGVSMRKWLPVFLAATLVSFADERQEKAQELCAFTKDVFLVLEDQSNVVDPNHLAQAYATSVEKLHAYKEGGNQQLAELAQAFIASLAKENEAKGSLEDAVASLGRLVKCSADNECFWNDPSFTLRKEDIQNVVQFMEKYLGNRLPKGNHINFHKLMFESRADREYDLALYAYFKIAEMRCLNS